ncbi:MAG: ABC transporter ATP-binding protein [Rhodocyclaceae bacterium]|nr:ABC transporter ATP-binding protein [Rhodocyclaceae bacterium]MCO5097818.1 ABC transporter ATP-binding protein [Rhodocyclaceae bacterium]
MSSDIVTSASGLTKAYRLFGHPGDRVKQFFSLGLKRYHREFTALKDVSFDIRKGETVGIIGRNGSGKSTLLQLVCGILMPTAGTITVTGRVSALLELGAGFDPEFTGRENVYFQGALMGFSKAEIDSRFDCIKSFADIGTFMDQPVRTYSSGMYVRLAFANMIHADSDILVIDEALAVGDEAFQRKCLDKLTDHLADQSKVLIFVSHNVRQIERICSRTLWLSDGRLVQDGEATEVCNAYQDFIHGKTMGTYSLPHDRKSTAVPLELEVTRITLCHDGGGDPIDEVAMHNSVMVVIDLVSSVSLDKLEILVAFHTADAIPVVAATTAMLKSQRDLPPGQYCIKCHIPNVPLLPGIYHLHVSVLDRFHRNIWSNHRVLALRVLPPLGANVLRMPPGLVDVPYEWSFTRQDAEAPHLPDSVA